MKNNQVWYIKRNYAQLYSHLNVKVSVNLKLFMQKSRHQAARGARVFASANTEGRERLVWREPVNQAAIRRPRRVAVA